MALGFTTEANEVEEEYTPLYKTIIECPICKDDVADYHKGTCTCKNLSIDQLESISKVRHVAKSKWTHFKTVSYNKEAPIIYDVLLTEEAP